jgi:hypothetical protein
MPKLHHILAIETGTKTKVTEKITAVYKAFQKPDLFNGHVKTFTPKDSNVESQTYEALPDERKEVQQNVRNALALVREQQTELFDLCLQRDATNMLAKADVVVDGVTVLKDAPVTYLLWLGHQLDDLHTEVKKIPTLDPAEKWTFDKDQNLFSTKPSDQVRTKKLEVPLVLFVGAEHAKNLLAIIKNGWVTRYECHRHGRNGESEEEARRRREDRDLTVDEVKLFHEHLEKLLVPNPEDQNGWVTHKGFGPGMVILHWLKPGWTFDNDGPDAQQCWPDVLKWLKEGGWKTPRWSNYEVRRKFNPPEREAR